MLNKPKRFSNVFRLEACERDPRASSRFRCQIAMVEALSGPQNQQRHDLPEQEKELKVPFCANPNHSRPSPSPSQHVTSSLTHSPARTASAHSFTPPSRHECAVVVDLAGTRDVLGRAAYFG